MTKEKIQKNNKLHKFGKKKLKQQQQKKKQRQVDV